MGLGERLELALLVSVVGASAVGLAGTNALPLIVGSLIDELGVTASLAGLLASLELAAVAVASLACASRISRLSRRRVAGVGALIAVAGHVAAGFAGSYTALVAARLLAGVGEGAALAAANAAAAGARDPDRLFANVSIVAGFGGALLLGSLPLVIAPYGYAGAFAVLAGIAILSAPVLYWLPSSPAAVDAHLREVALHPGRAAPLLLGAGLLAAGQGSIWAFAERIGLDVGLSSEGIGVTLAGSALAGLCGAALAAWIGTRLGRVGPLVVGLGLVSLSTGGLGYAARPEAYVALLVTWSTAFFFVMPFLLGTGAELDRSGRVTAAASGTTAIGLAIGPAFAGQLVTRFDFPGLGWWGLLSGLGTLALISPVARQLQRAAAARRPA